MYKENLKNILNEISLGNNKGEDITLIGATKTIPAEIINDAISLGLKVVAENRVQEFREKNQLIDARARQDFIGHLQTNKVKYLVGKVDTIHSIDSLKLAQEVSSRAEKLSVVQKVLIEINIGGELSKSGFTPENAIECALEINGYKNIKLVGVMAMLPKSEDEEYLSSLCQNVRAIYDKLIDKGLKLTTLSMGMSGDYKIAIKNGSNTIRLGSKIFGKRDYGEN